MSGPASTQCIDKLLHLLHADESQFVRSQAAEAIGFLGRQYNTDKATLVQMMLALLANGHLLVEGAPGLAKTRAIKEMAEGIEGSFHRIQFTPDLLPGDITGTDIFRPQTGAFEFQHGPIFNNLVLADEINRAPAKVQSALLEATIQSRDSKDRIIPQKREEKAGRNKNLKLQC